MAPQNIIEFWAVATRPIDANGLGIPVRRVANLVSRFKRVFTVLAETPDVYTEWERLVAEHQVVGKKVHDARIVATINVYGITSILTLNVGDFVRFPGITPTSPRSAGRQLE